MKAKHVKEFELGEHCFGEILRVNGTDYDDLTKKEIIELITDMLENSSSLMKEVFKNSLEYLEYDCVETREDSCDQCGSWNNYGRYTQI